jgi:hypothetical protein
MAISMPPATNPILWDELPAWAERLAEHEDDVFRDLQLFLLFSGLDAAEAHAVPTSAVNFDATILSRPAPANSGLDAFPHPLPISLTMLVIHRRFGNEFEHGPDGPWLFPAPVAEDAAPGAPVSHLPLPADSEPILDATGRPWPGPQRLRDTFLRAALESGADPRDVRTLRSPFDPTLRGTGGAWTAKRQDELAECIEQIAEHLEQRIGPAGQDLLGVHVC